MRSLVEKGAATMKTTQGDSSRSSLGTKREIRPGVWEVRVSSGYRADGKQRRKSKTVRGTAADADAAIVKLADEMEASFSIGDTTTLDDYFYRYFLPGREASTTNANAKTYASIYRSKIRDRFGSVAIDSITNLDIQRWINHLPPQSAPAYVRAFRAILNQAHFDHVIPRSPMEGYTYRLPKGRKTMPLPVWGADEVARCLDALEGQQLYPLWVVMVGCGLSRSEALALDWEDIAFTDVLTMQGQTVSATVRVKGAVTAEDGMKAPKNDRRYRTVPLAPLFAERLYRYRGKGPICQSKRYTSKGWKLTGHRMTPSYLPKTWKKYFAEGGCLEGLPFVGLNRMRATYSTLMQQAGIDSSVINAMQGRSTNSQVLYSNYLNPRSETFESAGRSMEALVSNG